VTPLRLLDSLDLAPHGALAIVVDAAGRQCAVPVVHDRDGWRRARAGDGIAVALTALVLRGETSPSQRFEVTRWVDAESLGDQPLERAVDVDQTNESVIVGEQVVVKWTVRPAAGPESAPDRLAALVAAGFTDMPRPWGLAQWRPYDVATPLLAATVVAYLPDARDGWDWAVDDVRAVASGGLSMAGAVAPWLQIGDLVARMHLSLPERGSATEMDAERWRASAIAELDEAMVIVDGPEGARLHEHELSLHEIIGDLGRSGGTAVQDIHGDLHVGQILRWQAAGEAASSYAVTDFDGNPVLSPADRAAPAPAAVDVAGLLQSLDHVGRVVSHRSEGVPAALVDEWIAASQSAMLDGYRGALAAAGRTHLLDESLLPALRARQVVREYLYAARHLPHWRYVPHAALPTVVAAAQTPGRPVRRPTDQA
jgi:maltokinase